jgi:hypothetical protein
VIPERAAVVKRIFTLAANARFSNPPPSVGVVEEGLPAGLVPLEDAEILLRHGRHVGGLAELRLRFDQGEELGVGLEPGVAVLACGAGG